jgi:hypothetical protein
MGHTWAAVSILILSRWLEYHDEDKGHYLHGKQFASCDQYSDIDGLIRKWNINISDDDF